MSLVRTWRSALHRTRCAVRDQGGAALVVALLMLLGLAAMGVTAVMIGSSDLMVAGGHRQRSVALNTAEAGLAEALHRMNQRPGTMVSVGGSNVDISIFDPATPPNPAWSARIFNTSPGAAPASGDGAFHTGTIQPAGNYLNYASSSDPDEAILIRHKLRDFDGDGTAEVALFDPSRIPPENPNTGFPIERITVTGREGQARRVIQADVVRFPLNPNVLAGLMANGAVDLRGNVTVCGRNHRIDTPAHTGLPNCSPAWEEADGNLYGVMTTGGSVGTRGSTDLLGSPSPTNTDNTNTFQSIAGVLGVTDQEWADIVANADRTSFSGSGPYDGITVINGNQSLNGGTGSGLLYVNGNLTLSGNFTWRGLIYVEGVFRITGTAWILGGAMANGGGEITAVDFGAGTPKILYSRAALVQTLMSAMNYIVLSWKEL